MRAFWTTEILFRLLLTNILWFIQTSRIESKVEYHAAHICEMERLIILKDLLPIGSRSNVLSDLCNSKFICDKNKDVVFSIGKTWLRVLTQDARIVILQQPLKIIRLYR